MRNTPLCLLLTLLLVVTGLVASPGRTASATSGDIAGTVTDTAQRPIPNALVRVQFGQQLASARSGADGRYRMANLTPGEYQLAAGKPAYDGQLRQNVVVAANSTVTVNFRLAFGSLTTGAVEAITTTSGGTPLIGTQVDLFTLNGFVSRLSSDDAGSAVFPGLPPGTYFLETRREGYGNVRTRTFSVRAGQLFAFRIPLPRDPSQVGELSGTIRDSEGFPVRGAEVEIVDGLVQRSTRSGDNGLYRLVKLIPGGGYRLRITARGFARQDTGQLTVRLGQATIQDFFLVPNEGSKGSITGLVRDNENRAIAFAAVQVTAGPVAGQTVQTDGNGRYLIQELTPSSSYAIIASQPGFAPAGTSAISVERARTTTVNLVLKNQSVSAGTLQGTTRVAGSLAPLPGVLVEVITGESAGLAVLTDSAGLYEFEGVIPDQGYTLRFTKDGFNVFSQGLINVTSGTTVTVNADLEARDARTGQLGGTIRIAGAGALAEAKVTLFRGPTSPLTATTTALGVYSFRNLAPGTNYAIRVEKRGFITAQSANQTVQNGQTTTVDLSIPRITNAGNIIGRVINLSQNGIVGARVSIIVGPSRPADVFTDNTGNFAFESLTAGTYMLQVTANGFPTRSQSNVVVSANSTARPTIFMTP